VIKPARREWAEYSGPSTVGRVRLWIETGALGVSLQKVDTYWAVIYWAVIADSPIDSPR
jgi:hypothetical protein